MELNGIAHIQLTVADVERSVRFYEPLLHFFEMKTIARTPEILYCVGSSREDVDAIFAFVERLGAKIVHGPQEDGFAPGYYSILFEDPDGIRIEVNHVPGRGHLDPNTRLPLVDTLSG